LNNEETETLRIAPDEAIPDIRKHVSFLGSPDKSNARDLGVLLDSSKPFEHHSKQLVGTVFITEGTFQKTAGVRS